MRLSMPVPPLSWVRCECGCGFEGPDPVGDYLLVEEALIRIDGDELLAEVRAAQERELKATAKQLQRDMQREGW